MKVQARPQDAADSPQAYLAPTRFLDSDHPAIRALADETADPADPIGRAVKLYYIVRDRFLYDPYSVDLSDEGMRASTVIARGRGYCVTKAALMTAAARAAGIPARLGFADVRNHLATTRLLEMLGTDVFYYHGYADLWLDGKWVKATPAFNIELCDKFRVKPLEFDGRTDSIFHPFDADNRRHMEYLLDRGPRADMPVTEIAEAMRRHYPKMFAKPLDGDFAAEAAAEN